MTAPLGQDDRMHELLRRMAGPAPAPVLDLDRIIAEGRRRRHRRRLLAGAGTAAGAATAVAIVAGLSGAFAPGGGTPQVTVAAGAAAPAVLTSSWQAGDPSRFALLDSTLRRDGDCVVTGDPARPSVVVWPRGYTARWATDGTQIEVLNTRGDVVARTGEQLSAGGGAGRTSDLPAGSACTGYAATFAVEQDLLPLDQSVPPAIATTVTSETEQFVRSVGIVPVTVDISNVTYRVYSRPADGSLTLLVHFTATFRSGGPGPFTDGDNIRYAHLTRDATGTYQWEWSATP